jgi:hypothetical protein
VPVVMIDRDFRNAVIGRMASGGFKIDNRVHGWAKIGFAQTTFKRFSSYQKYAQFNSNLFLVFLFNHPHEMAITIRCTARI